MASGAARASTSSSLSLSPGAGRARRNSHDDEHDGSDARVGRPQLVCRLESVRLVHDALASIAAASSSSSSSSVVVTVPPNKGGLRFVTEEAGCLQACVTLSRDAFLSFEAVPAAAPFRVSLHDVLDCLQLFVSTLAASAAAPAKIGGGGGTAAGAPLRVLYQGAGHPLVLVLQESDAAVVQCSVQTMQEAHVSDFAFLRAPVHNSAVLRSDVLAGAIPELEFGGATFAKVRMAPEPPRFRLESCSDMGGASLSIDLPDPRDVELGSLAGASPASSVFREFHSERAQVGVYRLSLLRRCAKALSISDMARVRMNADGMLSLVARLSSDSAGGGGSGGVSASAAAGADAGVSGPMLLAGGGALNALCFFEFLVVADELATMAEEEDDDDEAMAGDDAQPDAARPR